MANTIRDELSDDYKKEAEKALPVDSENLKVYKGLLRKRIEADAANPQQTDQNGYSQVDLRPDWYKTFLKDKGYDKSAPPLQSKTAGAVQAGLGVAAQHADNTANQLRGKDYGSGHAVAAGNMGLLLGLGSALTGALTNKDSNDFDKQQARAVKDASALKKNAKTGIATSELLGAANLEARTLRGDQLQREHVEKAAGKIADSDPNSQNSRRAQVGAASSGIVAPETANQLSAEQINANRSGFQQTQQQENHAQEFDRERGALTDEKISEEERADMRRVDQEHREQFQHRLQFQVPGMRWANDTPPPPAVAAQGKKVAAARQALIDGAQEMADIQSKLAEIGASQGWRPEELGPEKVGQYIDQYIGPQYTKDLLAKAKLVQMKMTTAARDQDNMGVMQQYEKAMQDAVNPTAGTIGGYFKGPAAWKAIIDYNKVYGGERLKKEFQLYDEGDETRPNNDPLAQPAESQVRRYARPQVRDAGGQVKQPGGVGTVSGDTLPVSRGAQPKVSGQPAPQAQQDTSFDAPGADEVLNGKWIITLPSGPTQPRTLTKKNYKMAIHAGYKVEQVK